jgi:hypothetical protein
MNIAMPSSVDPDIHELDRGLLVGDLGILGFSVSLLSDSDFEVRKRAFEACKALAEGTLAADGYKLPEKTNARAGDNKSTLTVGAIARQGSAPATLTTSISSLAPTVAAKLGYWKGLALQMSSGDVVFPVVRRISTFIQWVEAPPSLSKSPDAPEGEQVLRDAVAILYCQAILHYSQPHVWRMSGVLNTLVRLCRAYQDLLPGVGDSAVSSERQLGIKSVAKPKGGTAAERVRLSQLEQAVTLADALLVHVCTDVAHEAMLAVARTDASAVTWCHYSGGVKMADTASATWKEIQELLERVANYFVRDRIENATDTSDLGDALGVSGVVGKTFVVPSMEPGLSQAAAEMEIIVPHLPHLRRSLVAMIKKRALDIGVGALHEGDQSEDAFSNGLQSLWIMATAAWRLSMASTPNSACRVVCSKILAVAFGALGDCLRAGMANAAICCGWQTSHQQTRADTTFDSLRFHDAGSNAQWIAIALLLEITGANVQVRLFEPDGARAIQAQATLLLGQILSQAVSCFLAASEFVEAASSMAHKGRVQGNSTFSLSMAILIASQLLDGGVAYAFSRYYKSYAEFVGAIVKAKVEGPHFAHFGGIAVSTGVQARGRLLLTLLRLASICIASPVSLIAQVPDAKDMLEIISQRTGQQLIDSGVFVVLFSNWLDDASYVSSGNAAVPSSLAPFLSSYPVRIEAVCTVFAIGACLLRAQTVLPSSSQNAISVMATVRVGATISVPSAVLNPTPLSLLQDHIADVIISEGVIGQERQRLWKFKDASIFSTAVLALQGM